MKKEKQISLDRPVVPRAFSARPTGRRGIQEALRALDTSLRWYDGGGAAMTAEVVV